MSVGGAEVSKWEGSFFGILQLFFFKKKAGKWEDPERTAFTWKERAWGGGGGAE